MNSPIQVSNEDIKRLDAGALVELLWQLVNLELSTHRIESYDSQVPLSIYIPDGGIDGWARWKGGLEKTSKFPSRTLGFQSKATDLSVAGCAGEVKTKKGTLKPQVRRLMELGGTYVLFLGRDCVEESKEERVKALKTSVEEASIVDGEAKVFAGPFLIYDATDIASWANTYPAAVAAVFDQVGKAGAGAQGWRELSGHRPFEIPFADGHGERTSMLEALRAAAVEERSVSRVIGASGLGKSRLVFEAFRPPDDPEANATQAALSSRFCYLNAARTPEIEGIVRAWRRLNSIGTIVVDDCPLDLHEVLVDEVTRSDSRLSLITIGNDLSPQAYSGTPTRLIALGPAPVELIQNLLDMAFTGLTAEERAFIANEMAQGYPLMAIRSAEARLVKAPPSHRISGPTLMKLLGRSIQSGSRAERVISACALFENVGVDGEVAQEREFVRSVFCPDIPATDFYGEIVEFQKSGAVTRYGRVIQVRPRPLAIRLAADWWDKCPPERAIEIVGLQFPAPLAEAFCQRLRMLDFVPALAGITEKLCGRSGPFGQAEVLSSELGSQLFRAIVELNPVSAIGALEYAFGDWTTDQLRELKGSARRNIVWALEKLAFRHQTFVRAAQFLARLARAENETWSNNSTGIFAQLFVVLLSGTQAPLDPRLKLLVQMARSPEADVQQLAVVALDRALTTDNFTGMSGAEHQGSAGPLPEYRPKVWGEVFAYWRSCLEELVRIATAPTETGDRAAEVIAGHIRGLVSHGRLDDVEWAIGQVMGSLRSRGAVWAKGVDAIKDALKYEIDQAPQGTDDRVRGWLQTLEPTDPVQKLKLFVTEAPYEHVENEDGHWEDVAASNAERLGREFGEQWSQLAHLLPAVMTDDQRQGYAFGQGLARASEQDSQLYAVILQQLSTIPFEHRNSTVLSGWLSVVAQLDAAQCDSLFAGLAADSVLSQSLSSISRGLQLNDMRVAILQDLVLERRITPSQLIGLSYGQAMSNVSVDQVAALSEALLQQGIDAAWVALDILFMYSHGRPELFEALRPQFTAIICTKGMLSTARAHRASHEFETVALRLIQESPEVAGFITEELCRATVEDPSVSSHITKSLFTALFKEQPERSWPIVRRHLSSPDRATVWKLGIALGAWGRAGSKSRSIDSLDLMFLRAWCLEEPEASPPLIARIIRVLDPVEEGKWRFTPAAMMLLDDYAQVEGVLSGIGASMNSFSWSGSLVPFYNRLIEALTPLLGHGRNEVRAWAQGEIEAAVLRRTEEAQRDEEENAGR